MSEFKVFKEISMGGIAKEQLLLQLKEAGIKFNSYASTLFAHPTFSPSSDVEKVRLAKVTVAELGFTTPPLFQEIVEKAASYNLKLCPLELGPFLRLQYLDQPEGPYLTIASTKPEKDETYPNGFYIRNLNKMLWLRGYCATDDYKWPVDREFIFRL